jgi:hypothetical protein
VRQQNFYDIFHVFILTALYMYDPKLFRKSHKIPISHIT